MQTALFPRRNRCKQPLPRRSRYGKEIKNGDEFSEMLRQPAALCALDKSVVADSSVAIQTVLRQVGLHRCKVLEAQRKFDTWAQRTQFRTKPPKIRRGAEKDVKGQAAKAGSWLIAMEARDEETQTLTAADWQLRLEDHLAVR